MYNKFNYKLSGTNYQVWLRTAEYADGSLAVRMMCHEGPFANLSVYVEPLQGNHIAVDTNNMPEAEKFILDNNLGKPTGQFVASGYCVYPVYEMFVDKF